MNSHTPARTTLVNASNGLSIRLSAIKQRCLRFDLVLILPHPRGDARLLQRLAEGEGNAPRAIGEEGVHGGQVD
jgi:hypothetical protein